MDVTAGRDIEIVLGDLIARHDAAEFFFFAPGFESVCDPEDSVIGQIVLRVAFGEFAAGIEQEEFALSVPSACALLRKRMMPGAVVL